MEQCSIIGLRAGASCTWRVPSRIRWRDDRKEESSFRCDSRILPGRESEPRLYALFPLSAFLCPFCPLPPPPFAPPPTHRFPASAPLAFLVPSRSNFSTRFSYISYPYPEPFPRYVLFSLRRGFDAAPSHYYPFFSVRDATRWGARTPSCDFRGESSSFFLLLFYFRSLVHRQWFLKYVRRTKTRRHIFRRAVFYTVPLDPSQSEIQNFTIDESLSIALMFSRKVTRWPKKRLGAFICTAIKIWFRKNRQLIRIDEPSLKFSRKSKSSYFCRRDGAWKV